jgi:integrase
MARRRSPGEGSVHKRSDTGRWQAAIVVGYTPKGNPKRLKRDFDTKREADDWLTTQRTAQNQGTLASSDESVSGLLNQWLSKKKREVRDSTYQRYHDIINKLVAPYFTQLRVSDLKPTHIARWISDLQTSEKSVYSVYRAHEFFSMALNYALDLELIFRNPAHKVRPPKPPPPNLERLTATEVVTFLEWCEANGERFGGRHQGQATKRRQGPHKIYNYARLLFATGMRREEILGLRWQDIDPDNAMLRVNQTVVFLRGKATFGPAKTAEGARAIALDDGTLAALEEQMRHVLELRQTCKGGWKEHDLVFPSTLGTPLPESTLLRWWWDAIEGSGVTAIRLYDGRATWISEALKRGMNPKAVAKRVGHKDIAFMLKTYARPDEDEMRAAAKSLAEMYSTPKLRVVKKLEDAG